MTVYDAVYDVLITIKQLFGGGQPTREEVLTLESEYIMAYAAQGFPYGNNDEGLIKFIQETAFSVGED